MRSLISLTLAIFLFMPGASLAASDNALANAADSCNTTAYNSLKPNRSMSGVREMMVTSSEGKKYAKWMKKYLKLLSTCQTQSYLPDCKPASKLEDYKVRLKESRDQLKQNMLNNYLCNVTLVNKYASSNASSTVINSQIKQKVNKALKLN